MTLIPRVLRVKLRESRLLIQIKRREPLWGQALTPAPSTPTVGDPLRALLLRFDELLVGSIRHVEFVLLLTEAVLPLSVLEDEEGVPT